MTKKRLILFTGIIVAVVIMGIYGTYALDILVSEGTSEDYDMSLTFDIYSNTQKQVTNYIHKLSRELKKLPYSYGAEFGYSFIENDLKTIEDAMNEAIEDMKKSKESGKNGK